MSIIGTIKRRIKEKRTSESIATKEHRQRQKDLRDEVERLHVLFREKLMEINNKTINRLKIQIIEGKMPHAPTYKQLTMIINKLPYAVFHVKSEYRYCNCSSCSEGGSCDDPGPSGPFVSIEVETCNMEKFSHPPLSNISEEDIKDDEEFSTIILQFLEDFKDSQNRIKI